MEYNMSEDNNVAQINPQAAATIKQEIEKVSDLEDRIFECIKLFHREKKCTSQTQMLALNSVVAKIVYATAQSAKIDPDAFMDEFNAKSKSLMSQLLEQKDH